MSRAWKYGPYILTALSYCCEPSLKRTVRQVRLLNVGVIVHAHIHLWAQCSVFSPEAEGGAQPSACLISSAFWSSTTHQWRAGPQAPNITTNEWNCEVNTKIINTSHAPCLSFHLPWCPFSFWPSKFLPLIASVWHLVSPPSPDSSNQSSRTHEHTVVEIFLLAFFYISKACTIYGQSRFFVLVYLVYFFTQTFYFASLYSLSSNREGQSIFFQLQIAIDRF